jgi:hypothetical protein
MATVQAFCDRAMLLHDGTQRFLGDPEEAVLRYYRFNFAGAAASQHDGQIEVRLLDAWLEDLDGTRLRDAHEGRPFRFNVLLEALAELPAPSFGFELLNVDDVPVFGFSKSLEDERGAPRSLAAGQRLLLSTAIENQLVPGRYSMLCSVSRSRRTADTAMNDVQILDFLVKGSDPMPGMIFVRAGVDASIEGPST